MDLTDTQRSILGLIAEGIARDGMPPSQAELARAMGFAGVRAVQYHLEGLEQVGAIRRLPGKARGLKLLLPPEALHGEGDLFAQPEGAPVSTARPVRPPPTTTRCACRCSVGWPPACRSAPVPIRLTEDYVLLDRVFFSPAPDYLLRVKGDSMRDEGIFEGDLIGVHRTRDARSGQIVVARIEDEVTVKLLKIGRDRIRLLPRNPDHGPIEVRPDQDFAIEGLYCGLVRPNR
jgi:repressor LexA